MALVRRAAALAALLTFALGELGRVEHAAVEHAVCPEHGESMHAAVAGEDEVPHAKTNGRREDAHADHCRASFAVLAEPAPPSAPGATRAAILDEPLLGARDAAPAVPLLRYAPKASPPASA